MDTESLNISISKNSIRETDYSIYGAYVNDEKSRLMQHDGSGAGEDGDIAGSSADRPITDERIVKGEDVLGIYTVTSDEIRGGMGSVWRVRHKGWDIDLAMKRPQPRFFAEASSRRKKDFIEECERWIRLGLHPNIVSCYYVRDISGVPSIFSEWMDGGSLADRIRDGSLYAGTEKEQQLRILTIALGAAYGLRYAHLAGLVHQDIKPGNLLLAGNPSDGSNSRISAKVADFGLARARSKLGTGGGEVSSGYTIGYCPREQMQGTEAESWMDMYALALTILEMYAGGRTWKTGAEAGGSAEIAESLIDGCALEVPDGVRKVLLCCLTHRPGISRTLLDLSDVIEPLSEEYRKLAGRPYTAPQERASLDNADSLNNRALSFIDLGMPGEAEELWDLAFQADPEHLDSFFNRELHAVRSGQKYDFEAIEALSRNPAAEEAGLAGQIAAESGIPKPDESIRQRTDIAGISVHGIPDCTAARGDRLTMVMYHDGKSRELIGLQCMDMATGEVISHDPLEPVRKREAELLPERTAFESYAMADRGHHTHIRTMCISPEKDLAVFSIEDEFCLYDMNKRRIIRSDERVSGHLHHKMTFSPDGSLLVVSGEYSGGPVVFSSRRDDHQEDYLGDHLAQAKQIRKRAGQNFVRIFRVPSMEPLLEADLRFICFTDRDTCLLSSVPMERPKNPGLINAPEPKPARIELAADGSYGALYTWKYNAERHVKGGRSGKSGRTDKSGKKALREVFRFDMRVMAQMEHTATDMLLLYEYPGLDWFALDRDFRVTRLSRLLYKRLEKEQIVRYDRETGSLYTTCNGACARIAVWDLEKGRCLYTVPGAGPGELLWDEVRNGFIDIRSMYRGDDGGETVISFEPLLGRGETSTAAYRVSQILTVDERAEDDRLMAELTASFKAALESPAEPDLSKALECYDRLGEIDGYALSHELSDMEEALEQTAVRSGIRAGVPVRVSRERLPVECLGAIVERTDSGLSSYYDNYNGKRIILFRDPDVLIREVPLPGDAERAFVRNNRIYVFTQGLACMDTTLEGKPIGLGMKILGRHEDRHETTIFRVLDLDSDATHAIIHIWDRQDKDACGTFRFDMMDFTLTRLTEGDYSAACYLKDDTIVAAEKGWLVCIDHETGLVTQVSYEPPLDDVSRIVPSQEKDRVFVKVSDKLYLYTDDLRLLGSCNADSKGFQILPGGRFVLSGNAIWDVERSEIVWKCAPTAAFTGRESASHRYRRISVRPDGREVYGETEKIQEQGDFHVYRIVYNYEHCYAADRKQGAQLKRETRDAKGSQLTKGREETQNTKGTENTNGSRSTASQSSGGLLGFLRRKAALSSGTDTAGAAGRFSASRSIKAANKELERMRREHSRADKVSAEMIWDPEYKPEERSDTVKTKVDLSKVNPYDIIHKLDLGDGIARATSTVRITDVIDFQENRRAGEAISTLSDELGQDGRIMCRIHTIPPSVEIMAEARDDYTSMKYIGRFIKVLAEEGLLIID